MKDRPIQVGDLVQVVRWPCCGSNVGKIRVVAEIDLSPEEGGRCGTCGQYTISKIGDPRAYFDADKPGGANLTWLKRIPPLEELEGERTEEKLRAPA